MQYHEIAKSLKESGIPLKIEECHAIVSASACINPDRDDFTQICDCLGRVRDWSFEPARLAFVLEALWPTVRDSLRGNELDFRLLLPDENIANLSSRVSSFANWCGGFLAGLSVVTADNRLEAPALSADTRSFLGDLSRFVELDNETKADMSERSERDLYELIDYCRLGVIGVFLDLEKSRGPGAAHLPNAQTPKSIN